MEHAPTLSNRLLKSIRDNDIERVRYCIDQARISNNQDVNLEELFQSEDEKNGDLNFFCPLALACCLGHVEIMEELLKAGANPNEFFGEFHQPVMNRVAYENCITFLMIRCLVSYGADVNLADDDRETILHYLTSGQFIDTDENLHSAIKFLLDNGASFYQKNDRCPPIYTACKLGKIDIVNIFISYGNDLNDGSDHVTMLIEAAKCYSLGMFDLLLNTGSNKQLTPDVLIEPCYQNDLAMIARILDTYDVDINKRLNVVKPGMTILHYACGNAVVTNQTMKLLMDRGADVRAVSVTGDTVLHYAVNYPDCRKIRQLLAYNIPLNTKNKTPLVKLINSLPHAYSSAWDRERVLAFKMLAAAGAIATADVEYELNELCIKHPETELSDFAICSTRSLKEMCRLVIRRTIPVPVDDSLRALPIPKLLQVYLNF